LALTSANQATAKADLSAANDWVSLVDAKRWKDSWAAAGTLFKSQMTQDNWVTVIQPVREPLGAVASRFLKTITPTNSLPGAPVGEYELVQFQTDFASKPAATETVVLSHEASGWKVDGYFIR
jgi:hypothetical protein